MRKLTSFQEFVKRKNAMWQEMAMGQGSSMFTYQVSQPMANLLTLLQGDYLRARALDWLMFDGLQQAIIGRQQLCKKVNQELQNLGKNQKRPNIIRPVAPHAPLINPDRKIAMGEARLGFGAVNRDPWQHGDPISPCDLFSPLARKRIPELNTMTIDGLTIDQYFQEHYEPKEMRVDSNPGEPIIVNLVSINEILKSRNMQPFYYGGENGFLQYTEKGDYLNVQDTGDESYDDNQQFGPDLSLDTAGGQSPVTIVNGRPTLHLVGGSINKDDQRSAHTIKHMQRLFTHIANQLEKNAPIDDIDPDVVNQIQNALSLENNIKKTEIGLKDKGAGKGGAANKLLGLGPSQHGECYYPVKRGEDIGLMVHYFKVGLNKPTNPLKSDSIENPEVFGPEWDGNGPEPDGWYRVEGDGIIVKYSKSIQDGIYDYMIDQPLHSFGELQTFARWLEIPAIAKTGVRLLNRDRGSISLSTTFNTGVKSEPEVANTFKRVLFTMPDINPKLYTHKEDMHGVEVNVNDPNHDPHLEPLLAAGYKWNPNKKNNEIILSLGSSTYKIVQKDDNKFYLMVPTGNLGAATAPAEHAAAGKANLAGGVFAKGGQGGHVNTRPAGNATYDELLRKLFNGELGEKKTANNILELSCIKDAIKGAINNYNQLKHSDAAKINWGEDAYELQAWAAEGLKACSGKPAFQVGFLTPAQYENILKWSIEKQIDAAEDKGWGITGSFIKHGVGEEDQDATINDIMSRIKDNPIIDLDVLPPNVKAAIGENAYFARVRMVRQYILNMMTRESTSKDAVMQRNTFGTAQLQGGGEGGGDALDMFSGGLARDAVNRNDDDYEGEKNIVSPSDMRKMHNLPEPGPRSNNLAAAKPPKINITNKPQNNFFNNIFAGAKPKPKPVQEMPPQQKQPEQGPQDNFFNNIFAGTKPKPKPVQEMPPQQKQPEQGPQDNFFNNIFKKR